MAQVAEEAASEVSSSSNVIRESSSELPLASNHQPELQPTQESTTPVTTTRQTAQNVNGGKQEGDKKPPTKKTPNDFIFGKSIGEGSFSSVYLAKEVSTGTEYAIKVCDKKHILKEKKSEYIMREKAVLTKVNHPFIIRLYYTFQDTDRLYFVLQYARKGELLFYLNKLSSFDMPCSRFYAAEVVEALEYLQTQGVIHRDLKPENILLNERMHILITDFGSSKIIKDDKADRDEANANASASSSKPSHSRRNSFVGTAQYVSPEVLNCKQAYYSSDLWALGCIIFQFLSGGTPFHGGHEYQIFQKICKLEYEFPEGFNTAAADLVTKLLVIDPTKRLGCTELGGMQKLREHPFFEGVVWEGLEHQQAPELMPYLPATDGNPEMWSNQTRTGFDDRRLAEIIISNDGQHDQVLSQPKDEMRKKLEHQAATNEFHCFVENNLILKQGKVFKRKGLFARKRMLLLTEGPHLYYVDYANKVLKGEIPWSKSLRPEAKNFKIFFVHTPNRTYYLESRDSDAHDWERKINEVWQHYYGSKD